MHKFKDKPWFGLIPDDLSNKHLAELLECIAMESAVGADMETEDRKISAVGLADILMAAAERISDV